MRDNEAREKSSVLLTRPYVEARPAWARRCLDRLAERALYVVTDEYPRASFYPAR